MTDAKRCEPPEELRGVEHWAWLKTPTHGPVLCKWSEHRGVKGAWCWHYQGSRDGDISEAAIEVCGWEWVATVVPPDAIAALVRAAREAANALRDLDYRERQHGREAIDLAPFFALDAALSAPAFRGIK